MYLSCYWGRGRGRGLDGMGIDNSAKQFFGAYITFEDVLKIYNKRNKFISYKRKQVLTSVLAIPKEISSIIEEYSKEKCKRKELELEEELEKVQSFAKNWFPHLQIGNAYPYFDADVGDWNVYIHWPLPEGHNT